MKLVHTMTGTFSYMRYSYNGDFMIPTWEASRPTVTEPELGPGRQQVHRDIRMVDQSNYS